MMNSLITGVTKNTTSGLTLSSGELDVKEVPQVFT